MSDAQPPPLKPLVWIASSYDELLEFPPEVCREIGFALFRAQQGKKHPSAKPLRGFGGAGVIEIVERFDGDAYRCVYATRIAGRIYVLHAFQKKSTHGIATPKHVMELIRQRLRDAEILHDEQE